MNCEPEACQDSALRADRHSIQGRAPVGSDDHVPEQLPTALHTPSDRAMSIIEPPHSKGVRGDRQAGGVPQCSLGFNVTTLLPNAARATPHHPSHNHIHKIAHRQALCMLLSTHGHAQCLALMLDTHSHVSTGNHHKLDRLPTHTATPPPPHPHLETLHTQVVQAYVQLKAGGCSIWGGGHNLGWK